ncbi:MAG: alpha-glucosidase [Acholeplasmatales bacterium]|nr:MAG: alpha-glucosidase [Acholeplasmatales bacterium]
MTQEEKAQLIVYQVYPKSFKDTRGDGMGDLRGIIEKVPYLADLGVNALWLSPVYQSPMADNGYDISDYTAIHPDYGTMDDMRALIDVVHQHDMKLIMDLVINHTSDEHPWFIESRQSIDHPKRDFYIWRKGRKGHKPPNNWTSFFTGKAWTYDATTDAWYLHLFNAKQPDLNWENPEVYAAIKTMINYWVALGVDGFRCDVINLLSKHPAFPNGRWRIALVGQEHYLNQPKTHAILKRLSQEVFQKHGLITVGETVFVTPEEAALFVAPDRQELDMVFHFEHMGVDNHLKWFLRKFKPKKLKKILYKWQTALENNGLHALYFENHDQPRSVSRFGDDQTFHHASATLLATLLFTMKGIPYIYQGQEIGMTNARFEHLEDYRDVESLSVYDLGRKTLKLSHKRMMHKLKTMSRDNARTPMQWTDEPGAGFTTHEPWIAVNANHENINVEKAWQEPTSILHFYKHLIALRKTEPVLVEGRFTPYLIHHKSLYVFTRDHGARCVLVVANHAKKPTAFKLPEALAGDYEILLSNTSMDTFEPQCVLQPYQAMVLRRRMR